MPKYQPPATATMPSTIRMMSVRALIARVPSRARRLRITPSTIARIASSAGTSTMLNTPQLVCSGEMSRFSSNCTARNLLPRIHDVLAARRRSRRAVPA